MDEMHLNKVFNLTPSYLGAGGIAFLRGIGLLITFWVWGK